MRPSQKLLDRSWSTYCCGFFCWNLRTIITSQMSLLAMRTRTLRFLLLRTVALLDGWTRWDDALLARLAAVDAAASAIVSCSGRTAFLCIHNANASLARCRSGSGGASLCIVKRRCKTAGDSVGGKGAWMGG